MRVSKTSVCEEDSIRFARVGGNSAIVGSIEDLGVAETAPHTGVIGFAPVSDSLQNPLQPRPFIHYWPLSVYPLLIRIA